LRKEGAKLTADNATEASAAAGDQPCSSQSTSVRAQLNPVQYIESLLALKAQYEFYLRNAFGNDAIIKRAVQTDFEKFINDNPRSAEFMSLFIDDVLKNSTKRDDAEVESQLDKVMVLFRYLEEKDLFERLVDFDFVSDDLFGRYYKQHLAKRLLQNKNNSDDIEKVNALYCSARLTNNLCS
jgi:cullin 3